MTKTIIITGTHHTPAIELIRQLRLDRKFSWNIHYLSHLSATETHLKNTIIPSLPKKFHQLDCGKLDRHSPLKTIINLPKIITATLKANSLIKTLKPDIVVSFGGYVSVPVVFAAFLNHVPSISHEQTPTLSLSTKINRLFSQKIALSFPLKYSHPKHLVIGNLLRAQIFKKTSQKFHLSRFPLIYVTGGNQGSEFINQIISSILPQLISKYTLIHQTGNKKTRSFVSPNYLSFPYISANDIGWILHHSSLVISRSGANTCQEIVALNKKSILIPLPHTQQNEQLLNAHWVKKNQPKNTIIFNQFHLTPQKLLNAINNLHRRHSISQPQSPQPNLKLLKLIHETLN